MSLNTSEQQWSSVQAIKYSCFLQRFAEASWKVCIQHSIVPLYRPAFKTGARISVTDGLSAAGGVRLRSRDSARKGGKPIKYAPLGCHRVGFPTCRYQPWTSDWIGAISHCKKQIRFTGLDCLILWFIWRNGFLWVLMGELNARAPSTMKPNPSLGLPASMQALRRGCRGMASTTESTSMSVDHASYSQCLRSPTCLQTQCGKKDLEEQWNRFASLTQRSRGHLLADDMMNCEGLGRLNLQQYGVATAKYIWS